MNPTSISTRGSQTGAYLLEVLIAILVLSFGLLGLLGLMLNSMKLSSTSNYRAIATQEAAQIADTLRANVAGLYLFNSTSSCSQEKLTCYVASGGGCTPAELVCNEVVNWKARLAAALPHAATTPVSKICNGSGPPNSDGGTWACSNTATDPFVIRVCWDESRTGMGNAPTCVYTQL